MGRSKQTSAPAATAERLAFREPAATDGVRVHALVAACPPLDPNSLYCNLLQCTHFAGTSVLAERDGELLGWISGYRPPREPHTLFVWQVAVHERARGLGLARRMIFSLLERPALRGIAYIKTTVTPGNDASRALFRSIAERAGTGIRESEGFDEARHFRGRHDSEKLLTIGPFRGAGARDGTRSAA